MQNSAPLIDSVLHCDNLVARIVDPLRKCVTVSDGVLAAQGGQRTRGATGVSATSIALCLALSGCGSSGGSAASTAEASQMKTSAVIGEIDRGDAATATTATATTAATSSGTDTAAQATATTASTTTASTVTATPSVAATAPIVTAKTSTATSTSGTGGSVSGIITTTAVAGTSAAASKTAASSSSVAASSSKSSTTSSGVSTAAGTTTTTASTGTAGTTKSTGTSGGTSTGSGTTAGGTSTSSGTTAGGTSTGSGTTGSGTTVAAPAVTKKSISAWVSCNGTSDDYAGVAKAFDAAKSGAFTLEVDCPVRIHIGADISRPIFIDNGTTVEFNGNGKFTVDNVLQPAFVIANSSNITLTDWNVVYDASLPVNAKTGYYEVDGERVLSNGNSPISSAFNDLRLTQWLTAHRGITFDHGGGSVSSMWLGPTNTSSLFYVAGDSGSITITGMQISVPTAAGGERFIPMAFSLSANYKSNQTVTLATTKTAQYVAVPHNLNFTNIDLDGSYMGWQGNAQSVVIEKVRSHRYGDLQDANGGTVGGVGKWFAPPHLFYFRYDTNADIALVNKDISIHDVIDYGVRIGVARDKGGNDTISGFANSLKIGGNNCSVDQYVTSRPDGFMDVLASDGLKISNVTATYNSDFTHNVYPAFRFTQAPYKNVTFQNITMTDTGTITMHAPIVTVTDPSTENMVFSNVHVTLNNWGGSGLPLATFAGTGDSVSLDYTITGSDSRIISLDKSGLRVTLQATPATLKAGSSATINWLSRNATSCSGSGAWSGSMSGNGTGLMKSDSAGTLDYAYYCQNSGLSSSVTMPVVYD